MVEWLDGGMEDKGNRKQDGWKNGQMNDGRKEERKEARTVKKRRKEMQGWK